MSLFSTKKFTGYHLYLDVAGDWDDDARGKVSGDVSGDDEAR